jgi:hypothetical protein
LRPDIAATYGTLLKTDLADLAIADLKRFGWWDFTPEILALYDRPKQTKLMRRLILRYALCSPGDAAKSFVAEIRKIAPQAVAEAEEFLREVEGRK